MRQNKKAQLDVLFIIVIAFAFCLIIALGYKFISDLNSDIQTDPDSNAEARAASLAVTSRYPSIFDAGFIMFFVLVWIAILVSAWFIDTSPIFLAVSIIVFIFTCLVALGLSQGYGEIMTDADLSGFVTAFPMTNFVISNLLTFCIVIGFSVVVVLYGKSRYSNG